MAKEKIGRGSGLGDRRESDMPKGAMMWKLMMPGSAEFVTVCEKVVVEGEFNGGVVDLEEVECELGGLVMMEFLREAKMHDWVIEAIN